MGAIATFDYAAWIARYPEFSSVTEPLATAYFGEASLYLTNDGSGPVNDPIRQSILMNMLTAHIAELNSGVGGQAPSGLAGPITSASQGSVSVSVTVGTQPMAAAWYMATKYGAQFWRATASYRTMRYRAGPQRKFL